MDPEPEISMEEVHWEVLPESDGSRFGQRKKLNRDTVTTEDSAYSMGNSGAGTTLQSYFPIKQGVWVFVSC